MYYNQEKLIYFYLQQTKIYRFSFKKLKKIFKIKKQIGWKPSLYLNIIKDLKNHIYEPTPLKRLILTNGFSKFRILSFPSLRDTLLQIVLKKILNLLWKTELRKKYNINYYKRKYYNIFKQVNLFWTGIRWLIRFVLVKTFTKTHHFKILIKLRKKVVSQHFLELIHKLIKTGYIDIYYIFNYEKNYFLKKISQNILLPFFVHLFFSSLDIFLNSIKKDHRLINSFLLYKKINFFSFFWCRYLNDIIIGVKNTYKKVLNYMLILTLFLQTQMKTLVAYKKTKIIYIKKINFFLGNSIIRSTVFYKIRSLFIYFFINKNYKSIILYSYLFFNYSKCYFYFPFNFLCQISWMRDFFFFDFFKIKILPQEWLILISDVSILIYYSLLLKKLILYYSFINKKNLLLKFYRFFRNSCILTLCLKHGFLTIKEVYLKYGYNLSTFQENFLFVKLWKFQKIKK